MSHRHPLHHYHAQPTSVPQQTYWNINNYSAQQNSCYCRVHSIHPTPSPISSIGGGGGSTLAPQFVRQYRNIDPSYSTRGIVPEPPATPPSRRHKSSNASGTCLNTSLNSSGNSSTSSNSSSGSLRSHKSSKSSSGRHHRKSRKDCTHSPTQLYKSAPSSPVNTRHEVYSNHFAEDRRAYLTLDKLERGGLISDKPSAASTPLISGCCGGVIKDFSSSSGHKNKKISEKRRSGSYSALDSISTDSTSELCEHQPPAPPPVSSGGNCVRNLVSWMTKVGKGTSALLDNLPFKGEDHHVVMVGLDSAGKTTVLYRLKFDQYINTVPTIGFNCEKIRGTQGDSRGLLFLVWDVGGQEKIRPLWRPYTRATDGIIFVVDSTDTGERLEEAKLELHRIMKTPDNVGVPLLVIANKQDLPMSKTAPELERVLELSTIGTSSLWHLEPCCAVTGEGLDIAIDRLHELIIKRRKIQKRIRNKTR
eukprot:TRINITY_DN8475_c0_g1_i1.p1 TRINITY_DN8475_c0_g1~~TRINITY_DN8475_c0_g1_i1.p1  ORF type:complete len:476 (-),score=120.47 TRINITY_DN8475_c0_g1_i1:478-1905(-)